MTIAFDCTHCRTTLRLKDEFAGKRGKCPQCKGIVQVPTLDSPKPTVAAHEELPRTTDSEPLAQKKSSAPASIGVTPSQPSVPAQPYLESGALTAASLAAIAPPTAKNDTRAPAKSTVATPASPASQAMLDELLRGFQGELAPKPFSITYFLGLMMTATFMVMLPLIYLSMIGAIIYVVYLHLISNVEIIWNGRKKDYVGGTLLYLLPVFVGGTFVLYMIKPLFARSDSRWKRTSLSPEAEPVLFEFVHRICDIVGAPRPRQINVACNVNASASFRNGWMSMLGGKDMVLTIGLPLAAGLTMRQLAGVIAHEFGHFSQGMGMRLSYVIYSIHAWFERVVYERDEWDDWLKSSTNQEELAATIFFYLLNLGVWVTRKILWALMMLGKLAGGYMKRQMEYDADSYEARLVGSECFETTSRQLALLTVAYDWACSDLNQFLRDGQLADDLPKLMIANIPQIPAELKTELDYDTSERKTGWFDSHPADKDRIAAARRFSEQGIFQSSREATELFHDFHHLACDVTLDFYRNVFDEEPAPSAIHPVETLLAKQTQDTEAIEARNRFLLGQLQYTRPVQVPSDTLTASPDAKVARDHLLKAREIMKSQAEAYQSTYAKYEKYELLVLKSWEFESRLSIGMGIPQEAGYPVYLSGTDCVSARERYQTQKKSFVESLDVFEQAAGNRLFAAAQLLFVPRMSERIPDAPLKLQQCEKMIAFIAAYTENTPLIDHLRNMLFSASPFPPILEDCREELQFMANMLPRLRALHDSIPRTSSPFESITYPFDHGDGPLSVSDYLVGELPDRDSLYATYRSAKAILDRLTELYIRCMDRMSLIAEEVESQLGLQPFEPLPDLPEN